MKPHVVGSIVTLAVLGVAASPAGAQPTPLPLPPMQLPDTAPPPLPAPQPGDASPASDGADAPVAPYDAIPPTPPPVPELPKPELPPRPVPQTLLFAPTARLLAAGQVAVSGTLDTLGGAQLDLRAGLGGVAEFGVGSTDYIRSRDCPTCDPGTVRFVPMGRFVMGLDEDRLFKNQPALALGFEKSFTRNAVDRDLRFASLYFVASKKLGMTQLHLGAQLWDAEIERPDTGDTVALHDDSIGRRIRPSGGVDIKAKEHANIVVDLSWNPELTLNNGAVADTVRLRPMLAWGVRYGAGRRVSLEAGVRVPDIADANLLDAEIFAKLRVVSDVLRDAAR